MMPAMIGKVLENFVQRIKFWNNKKAQIKYKVASVMREWDAIL